MKILIISNSLPSKNYPLHGIFAYDQAKVLNQAGIDVTLFAIDLRSFRRKRPYGIKHEIRDGINSYTISFPLGNVPNSLFCYVGSIALRILYRKVYSNVSKPNVIHAHFTDMGKIASSLSKRIDVPYIITEHSSYMNQGKVSRSLKRMAISAYSKASQTIAVSSLLANSIKRLTGIDSLVVPNVIDFGIFSKLPLKQHEGYRIVTTANLIERKRVLNIIKVIEHLALKFPNIYLDIVGDGPQRQLLQDYVNTHKLTERIHFHGRLTREETAKIYSVSDCFVLVSEVETFGVVYVEAMASGLPVVASKCGGPEDFVTDENGILVEVDNQNQLEDAIIRIMNIRYDSEKIRNNVREKYGPTSLVMRLESIYNRILFRESCEIESKA